MHARSSGLQAMEEAAGGGAKVAGLVVESPENLPRWLLPLDFEQKCRSRLVLWVFFGDSCGFVFLSSLPL